MAVLAGATSSGKQFYQGQPSTTVATIYTAPVNSTYVTSPSSTAYVKELIIANTTSTAATISVFAGGNAAANAILSAVSVAANDTKIISGINLMIPAGGTLQASQGTAAALTLTVSGVEVV